MICWTPLNQMFRNGPADQEKQMSILRDQELYRKEFLANIGHELKTPIFSIQGYLHTLLDGAMEDEKVNLKFIKKAAKNADRLQELVEDLMAISKIEKGEVIINPPVLTFVSFA